MRGTRANGPVDFEELVRLDGPNSLVISSEMRN